MKQPRFSTDKTKSLEVYSTYIPAPSSLTWLFIKLTFAPLYSSSYEGRREEERGGGEGRGGEGREREGGRYYSILFQFCME